MKPFAKIFYSAKYGQILVQQVDDGWNHPAIFVYFQAPGVPLQCAQLSFEDSFAGTDQRQLAFDGMELHQAEQLIHKKIAHTYGKLRLEFDPAIPGGWIACAAEMPDDGTRVLACIVNEDGCGEPFIGHHDGDDGWSDDEGRCWSHVTHWQHLPDFPA